MNEEVDIARFSIANLRILEELPKEEAHVLALKMISHQALEGDGNENEKLDKILLICQAVERKDPE